MRDTILRPECQTLPRPLLRHKHRSNTMQFSATCVLRRLKVPRSHLAAGISRISVVPCRCAASLNFSVNQFSAPIPLAKHTRLAGRAFISLQVNRYFFYWWPRKHREYGAKLFEPVECIPALTIPETRLRIASSMKPVRDRSSIRPIATKASCNRLNDLAATSDHDFD
jgi:hypothetical protein